ncbi:hypothetical protein EYF80_037690 [Liparis tanakae]|uniref:Uncharacterized protein n=1 Tax=Liparis tanakae TaxID=230148 RepID=A0A4Z2GHD8_9TELE|nr:hypothetical protein EYF80_037690 [Liparis tanakae]
METSGQKSYCLCWVNCLEEGRSQGSSLDELTECPVRVVRCCSWGERSCRLLARVGIASPGGGKATIPPSMPCGRWRSLLTYMECR